MTTNEQRRRIQNTLNRVHGQEFEEKINAALEFYESIGFAEIEKTPEPLRILQHLPGGKFLAVFTKKAQPDYKGTIKGGLSVVFEAKYTSALALQQSKVTQEQGKRMDSHQRLGARCFVVAGFSSGKVYTIPWPVWSDMKSRWGRKYITEEDIAEYRVPVSKAGFPRILE